MQTDKWRKNMTYFQKKLSFIFWEGTRKYIAIFQALSIPSRFIHYYI